MGDRLWNDTGTTRCCVQWEAALRDAHQFPWGSKVNMEACVFVSQFLILSLQFLGNNMPIRAWATNLSEENYKGRWTWQSWPANAHDFAKKKKKNLVELWHAQSVVTFLFPNTNPYNLRDAPYLRVTGLILAFSPSKLQQVVPMYTLRTLTERNNQKWLSGTISMVRPRLLANTLHSFPSPPPHTHTQNIYIYIYSNSNFIF